MEKITKSQTKSSGLSLIQEPILRKKNSGEGFTRANAFWCFLGSSIMNSDRLCLDVKQET